MLSHATESFIYRTGVEEHKELFIRLAGMLFEFAGSSAERITLEAVGGEGSYGYMEDHGIERRFRDCKGLRCMVGSHLDDILAWKN